MIIKAARVVFLLFFLIFSGSFINFSSSANAKPYIVVDVETGRVLAHNDAFDRWYPASLTKMMTVYVAFRALRHGEVTLETPVIISAAAAKLPPSRSGYKVGTVLPLDSALAITLVKSTNDIATSIGETISGSTPKFVDRMNFEAQRLGMMGTHFSNASGLPDPENYSTARDMALLSAQIRREFPEYGYFFRIEAVDLDNGSKIQPNSNNLVGRFQGADGLKTGFICASGYNLAASATRDNRTLVVVVLGADRVDTREALAAELLSNGFKTAGSSEITIANMRPYGTFLREAADIRSEVCSQEAWQARAQYIDKEGKTIFNSNFIGIANNNPNVVKIRYVSPQKNGPNSLPKINAPTPISRPVASFR